MTAEFGVNPPNLQRDETSQVIPLADGGFAVVWASDYKSATLSTPAQPALVQVRFYNADGSPRTAAITIDSLPAGDLPGSYSGISGAQLSNGNIAVFSVLNDGQAGGSGELSARILDLSGSTVVGEVPVSAIAVGNAYPSGALALAQGRFLLFWEESGPLTPDPAAGEISAQLFNANGTPIAPAFTVNTATAGKQSDACAAVLADGGFVLAWVDRGLVNYSPDFTIRMQRYDAAGIPQGGEVSLTQPTGTNQSVFSPSIAASADGGFLVAWKFGVGGDALLGQMFDASGQAAGGVLTLIENHASNVFSSSNIVARPDGGFAVFYTDFNSGPAGTTTDPVMQLLDSAGRWVGGEIQLTASKAGPQDFNSGALLANGDMVANWFAPGAEQEIRARVISVPVLSSTFGSGGSASPVIAENTTAVTAFSATSTIAGPLTYAIAGGADAALFALDPLTRELRFIDRPYAARPADAGGNNIYDVIISVSNGLTADEQRLSITVAADPSLQTIFGTELDDKRTAASTKSAVMYGFGGKDVLKGAGFADMLFGGTGNDNLSGLAGDDLIEGGDGNDKLDGGTGSDIMRGGHGNDSYVVDSAGDSVSETGGSGTDSVSASISYVLGDGLEKLVLTGAAALNGSGNALANTLTGNAGHNVLLGYGGKDALNGGDGNDWLDGGAQADKLRGGNGADTFALSNPGSKTDRDTILDFAPGQDHVAIDRAAFAAFAGDAAGALSAANFALNTATTADHHLIYDTATGILSYDADGAGGAAGVQIAQFTGLPALSAADFLLV